MTRILLVDDNVDLLDRLATQLRSAGYSVDLVSDTSHAAQLLAEQSFDLVVLDTGIERGAGWQLLEQYAPRVAVIVASGEALEEDIVRCLELGALDFIAKPFRI
ncbi:MAG TPA: response regulator, partial [Roseiflexaceae bacterium]|nr:response regulator [Roseiflexaceae bacterium]